MWIRHLDFRFNFTTWDELVQLPIHQQATGQAKHRKHKLRKLEQNCSRTE